MTTNTNIGKLDVDLKDGVVPISKAASALAALIKRSQARKTPIIITQKGYPSGVLLPIEVYEALRSTARDVAAVQALADNLAERVEVTE